MSTYTPSPIDFDPFDGDFGCPGDKTLNDKMVFARKGYACVHCKGPILAGEKHRSRTDVCEGELMSWRWCAACCAAMVAQINGSDENEQFPFEERIAKATGSQP